MKAAHHRRLLPVVASAALAVGLMTTPAQATVPGLTSCASTHATSPGRLGTTPPGAATGAVTGQAVTTAFSLGGDDLTAAPPPAGYVPAVGFTQAGCELVSALGVDGSTPPSGRLALATLTLRTDINQELFVDPTVNSAIPTLGSVPAYQSRVAWILISPAQLDCPSSTAPPGISPYQVRAVDAATGASAVFFQDTLPPCAGTSTAPLVSIPYQQVSVPWRLVSRARNEGHAKVTAAWASCEKFTWTGNRLFVVPPPILTPAQMAHNANTLAPYIVKISHRPLYQLTIPVNRPIGPQCGKRTTHVITVYPQELDKKLPQQIRHGPLGALITQRY